MRLAKDIMRTIKLTENLSSYDKMRLFDSGQRRENVKACGVNKLINYYRLCLNNGFNSAERQVAAELLNRGMAAASYVKPQAAAIDATQFTPYEPQYILAHKSNPDDILDAAINHPFPNLTESETLTVYLIWSIVLNLPNVTTSIKNLMQVPRTYYASMPQIIKDVLAKQDVADTIAKILNGLSTKKVSTP